MQPPKKKKHELEGHVLEVRRGPAAPVLEVDEAQFGENAAGERRGEAGAENAAGVLPGGVAGKNGGAGGPAIIDGDDARPSPPAAPSMAAQILPRPRERPCERPPPSEERRDDSGLKGFPAPAGLLGVRDW